MVVLVTDTSFGSYYYLLAYEHRMGPDCVAVLFKLTERIQMYGGLVRLESQMECPHDHFFAVPVPLN